jgi:outer membrane lipoprotein LolB
MSQAMFQYSTLKHQRPFMKNCLFTCLVTLLLLILTAGCSSLSNNKSTDIIKNTNNALRIEQLNALNNWQVSGKIAFISKTQRDSLSLNWQINGDHNNHTLKLTTFLGIQALSLESINGLHTVEVDGKHYQTRDLAHLIYSLTGFTLPTQALTSWLKGLAYLHDDQIKYHESTQFPLQLTSQFSNKKWTVHYDNYQQVKQYQLATKFTIKQDDLTIKINIHQWNL